MVDIKEQTDKIYQALYGEEVRSAIIEALISMDRAFTSKIAEQRMALERTQRMIERKNWQGRKRRR